MWGEVRVCKPFFAVVNIRGPWPSFRKLFFSSSKPQSSKGQAITERLSIKKYHYQSLSANVPAVLFKYCIELHLRQ